ncbi:MAG: glycogen synthase [Bacteroidetes bacterium]|nr:MAG: glycogen synthase [Bacteroidota bacterium]
MRILHISMECYPAAKFGGLGDVVGALPIYLNKMGIDTSVVMPFHHTKWLLQQQYREVFSGHVRLGRREVWFNIQAVENANLGFPLYVVNIPGFFDRPGVYGPPEGGWYDDELQRNLLFQQAVLKWVVDMQWKPRVLHCHDHHTGLIPFMVKYCPEFSSLRNIATVFTIHNGAYHGAFGWDRVELMPYFYSEARGFLDWSNTICPLAAAIKCCWRLTTVSKGYLEELLYDSNGMEALINQELPKARGIVNGIDTNLWDPATDERIAHRYDGKNIADFKEKNKVKILDRFRIIPDLPIVTFIGRLVKEKGADLLPDTIRRCLANGLKVGFVVLGTGDKWLMDVFDRMRNEASGYFDVSLEYNESLAHQLYAGSDFLIMPSRVEPCGLNQMYACRYGTVPIVRSVGGLKDTIPDIGEKGGRGIRFNQFTVEDASMAVYRAAKLYENTEALNKLRQHIMSVDFSWERSAKDYQRLYEEVM